MAFTSGNDYNILQETDSHYVSAGEGDDTYILSTVTIGNGQEVEISDTKGANTLQLVDGLNITSSMVTNDAVQLTLSNDAMVTIMDTASFSFDVGGNALVGPGDIQAFDDFVTTTLGIEELPAPGELPVSGGSVTIGTSDPSNIIDLVEGSNEQVNGTEAADVFTFDVAVALADVGGTTTQININDFDTAADRLELDLITAIGETTLDQLGLDGVEGIEVLVNEFNSGLLISFGSDANGGEPVVLNLTGVSDPSLVNVEVV